VTDTTSPAVHRRRLRTELREGRQRAELTQEDVATAMDWSLSKVIRIESGAVSISTNDLRALLRLYRILDRKRVDELIALARAARQSSWLSKYRESLPPRFFQYLEYEGSASVIRTFEPILIPGLLQTREYASAIMEKLGSDVTPGILKDRLEVRMLRQRILEQERPPLYFAILDEAAIRRLIGEALVSKGQLSRLLALAQRSNITIEIVPFQAGIHRGMIEPFEILEFPDSADSDLLYLEGVSHEIVLSREEAGEISDYRETFEKLREASLGPKDSIEFIRKVMDEAK
jgi:transcriptional regulator with XRE-family HTH domain